MRIKLVESAQPINKLESNIERNILPEFEKYGFNFSGVTPLEISNYIYVYRGNSKTDFVSLRLNTASKEIDVWNETNSDSYKGDLFAELTLNGENIDLGVISSRDPESVDAAMVEFDKNDYTLPTEKDLEEKRLIPPKSSDTNYKSMTKEEWQNEYKRLQAETDELRQKINAMRQKVLDEELKTNEKYQKLKDEYAKASSTPNTDTYWQEERLSEIEKEIIDRELGSDDEYNSLNDELKQKADYLNNVFYKKIYPFNEIE